MVCVCVCVCVRERERERERERQRQRETETERVCSAVCVSLCVCVCVMSVCADESVCVCVLFSACSTRFGPVSPTPTPTPPPNSHSVPPAQTTSTGQFTTSFFGGRCRKTVLGVRSRPCRRVSQKPNAEVKFLPDLIRKPFYWNFARRRRLLCHCRSGGSGEGGGGGRGRRRGLATAAVANVNQPGWRRVWRQNWTDFVCQAPMVPVRLRSERGERGIYLLKLNGFFFFFCFFSVLFGMIFGFVADHFLSVFM